VTTAAYQISCGSLKQVSDFWGPHGQVLQNHVSKTGSILLVCALKIKPAKLRKTSSISAFWEAKINKSINIVGSNT
jgi:hypothetical protein